MKPGDVSVYRRWPGGCGCAVLALLLLTGCSRVPTGTAIAVPTPTVVPVATARAIARQAARLLVPYHDPLHTFELERPQTWIVLDARTNPHFARALGDGVRFFEPVAAADPDAGRFGKLWVDVLPVHADSTPRQMLLQPFVAADYPPPVLHRMSLAPIRLGGVPGYRLVTLASKTQVTLLLVRWHQHYYRLTVYGAAIPSEVQLALRTWHFVGRSRS